MIHWIRTTINTKIFILILVFVAPLFAQRAVTPIFPLKDGFVSPDSCSGEQKELLVDAGRQSVGWVVFKPQQIDFKNIKAIMLMLHIKSVLKPGLCGINMLVKRITAPENKVSPIDLKYDDMPIAALPLDSSFANQMLLIEITELVKSKTFRGIAVKPISGLSAVFSSKEGYPPPAVLLTHDTLNPNPSKWFNGAASPDTTTPGKTGDFYVDMAKGIIYRRSTAQWDSAASLTIPPEPPAPVTKPNTLPVKKPVTTRKSVKKTSP
jgi:hypothetical protein